MNQLIEKEIGKMPSYSETPGLLLVDSETGNLRTCLPDLNIPVYSANSEDEAIEQLASHQILLILINPRAFKNYPYKGVYKLNDAIRNTGQPIILVTTSMDELESFGQISGNFYFVPNPPNPSQLTHLISSYAAKQSTERQLRDAVQQLKRINEELTSLSYAVSHDLRAPLRAVTGFSNVLLKKAAAQLEGDHLRYLNMISDNVAKLNSQIDDLLSLSRLSHQELHLEQIDLQNLILPLFDELATNLNHPSPRLDISEVPMVKADRNMMKLMMTHLLDNAIKFSIYKTDPTIEFGFDKNLNGGCFYLKDNGIGFEGEYRDRLFELFQKLHSEEEYPGNGVGLAIVKRIITRHHGNVWGNGEISVGTTIYFSIPE